MLTVHATTSSHNTVGGVVRNDWRFGPGALEKIIPVTSGAARMIGKVVPELNGRINGMAVRVPVSDVSLVDLTCRLREDVSYKNICTTIRAQATNAMGGILAYCDEPVVSTEYDDEWGYACRCLDLVSHFLRAG